MKTIQAQSPNLAQHQVGNPQLLIQNNQGKQSVASSGALKQENTAINSLMMKEKVN